MTTNLFVIANVKQLRTYVVLEFYCLFPRTSWCAGILNSAIFNSFHNRVEFGTILEDLQNFGGGGWTPQTPPRYAPVPGNKKKEVTRSEVGQVKGVGGWTQPPFCFQLKERHFADSAEFERESLASFGSIFIKDFKYFQQWKQRWDCCMQSQGECFEVD